MAIKNDPSTSPPPVHPTPLQPPLFRTPKSSVRDSGRSIHCPPSYLSIAQAMDSHSPDLQVQRSPLNPRHLQSTSLSALADDASTLAAAQQQLAPGLDPNDAHSFQPFQSAIENFGQAQQHHADHPVGTPVFIRPPRPGEPINTLLITPQQQQQHQVDQVSPRRQERLSDGSIPEFRDLSSGGNGQTGMPGVPSSQSSTRTNSNASESRNNGFEILQAPVSYLQQQEPNFMLPIDTALKPDSHAKGMKLVPDPPDLDAWREKLFNIDEVITLSEEQFQTYFPHIDNVYSHRSTQRYKRKPFVSHYWDCRLKGRPPGTPKSEDPNKKKRKRTARQRDLCDVKIKITEYFPGFGVVPSSPPEFISGNGADSFPPTSELLPGVNTLFSHPNGDEQDGSGRRASQPFGVLTPNPTLPAGHPGANGERYFTIQRVNGNGANGKSDGVGGGHRHTLEESDRVKKNSVQRHLLKGIKEKKKPVSVKAMSVQDPTQQKTYHTKATGLAATTAINHAKENDLKLYGSCFCPFVQRVWIALERKGIPYQYIEVDPYQKPQSLLEVNPRGLVPALRHGNWGCYESTVLLEYLEDLNIGTPLLPPGDPQLRAHCRIWTDHINRHIVPTFYRVLQEQDQEKQISNAQELRDSLNTLVTAAHVHGPFFLGSDISFVDIQAAPWIVRLSRVLKPYRGWPDPEAGSRWAAWVNALETNEHVRATTSTDELYLDSYERYARM
ncbi:hypothetical protein AWENTII_004691 [Aspergillus wentii]